MTIVSFSGTSLKVILLVRVLENLDSHGCWDIISGHSGDGVPAFGVDPGEECHENWRLEDTFRGHSGGRPVSELRSVE